MFGGADTNPLFSLSTDNGRLPYNANALPPMQLDVFGGCNADIMNVAGSKNGSLANIPMNIGRSTLALRQHKFPVPLHDNICLDEGGQAKSMLKQIPVSTGLKLSYGEEELNSSISSAVDNTMLNLSSVLPHTNSFQTELVRQNDEFDHYIRVQEETIRKGITELKHRHTIALLNALEKEVSSKLQEKDVQIETLNRKNKVLTEKIKQLIFEAQSWHDKAKQNESLINVLRSNINQVLLKGGPCHLAGSGENTVDDAASTSNVDHFHSMKEPMFCKACRGKEISVLLLPCRHLCLCIECDAFIDICPVCRVKKAGSLQVYMS